MQLHSELLQFMKCERGSGQPVIIRCDGCFLVGLKRDKTIEILSEQVQMNLKPLVFECLADISEHSINSLADWVGAEHINANELASHTYKKAHELLRRAGLLSVNALELRA